MRGVHGHERAVYGLATSFTLHMVAQPVSPFRWRSGALTAAFVPVFKAKEKHEGPEARCGRRRMLFFPACSAVVLRRSVAGRVGGGCIAGPGAVEPRYAPDVAALRP